ncbi:MAG: winged helix-turn-helix domain-containing protein [Anaerolineales bacterium]|nr:winged helix-turn-helix domain-containing protein [Anaerolineales bacterium]
MDSYPAPENLHELRILEQIERDPEATQADLASRMGVAVGTVNWYVKRLVKKGHIKVTRLQRRRLRYLITPEGISEKTRLAMEYVQISMGMYRATRQQARDLLSRAREAGFQSVTVLGQGDLVDVCRLTCLEQSVQITSEDVDAELPVLRVSGSAVMLEMPDV